MQCNEEIIHQINSPIKYGNLWKINKKVGIEWALPQNWMGIAPKRPVLVMPGLWNLMELVAVLFLRNGHFDFNQFLLNFNHQSPDYMEPNTSDDQGFEEDEDDS